MRQLEKQSARPGLWDDAASAQTVMKRLAEAQETVSTWRDLERAAGDLRGLAEMGESEEDEGLVPELTAEVLHDARRTFTPEVARSAELLSNQLERFEALPDDADIWMLLQRHD